MNSNYGKSNSSSGSFNSFNFDLGINSGKSRPLNDQKSNSSGSSYTYTSNQPRPNAAWTHQPAAPVAQPGWGASLSGPTSMVGDIFGKSWGSTGGAAKAAPAPVAAASSIGIAKKDVNLFGDLVNSALGQNKGGGGGGSLKNGNGSGNKNAFSVGGMADSLPKTGGAGGSWGSNDSFGKFTGGYSGNKPSSATNVNLGGGATNVNLGGGATKDPKLGSGIGMRTNQDPFGDLFNMGAKPSGGMNIGSKANSKSSSAYDSFGGFQNAGKNSGSVFPSSATSNNSSSTGSKMDEFGIFNTTKQTPPVQSSGNDFDAFFPSSTSSTAGTTKGREGSDTQQFEGGDDWGFHGSDDTNGTTELEGLPPPPAGVSGSMARTKGMDNYKGGQYADAIKWLSWAIILLEKAGDNAGTTDVLSSRASCYKEVGEYKKAVADCTKILEHNGDNVDVLVQRALLYESMEKYKLGAEDLRKVMNLDSGNRVARSTIHRLTKMAAAC